MSFLHNLPPALISLGIVFFFSLLIGMEQKRHFAAKSKTSFGSDRTFTFLGLLGYLLALLPSVFYFVAGLIAVSAFLAIFYFMKVKNGQGFGLTSIILALLIFSMPLVVIQQPHWLSVLLYILLLLLAELKGYFQTFSEKLDKDEFFTLSKFIIMAVLILPVLPVGNISPFIPVSPYKIWLAIVVISGISYFSYLLKKFVFPSSGLLITGILGGLYSSTATTFIIARKSKEEVASAGQYAGAILAATSMMYIRIFILIVIFDSPLAALIWPYFLGLFGVSLLIAWWIYQIKVPADHSAEHIINGHSNPLEFKIAIMFAALYLLFSALTQLTLHYLGTAGLTGLSFLVGFTDIDPFLLNLFQATHNISLAMMGAATLQAMFSNNLLKMVYSLILSVKRVRKLVTWGFALNILAGILAIGGIYLFAKPF